MRGSREVWIDEQDLDRLPWRAFKRGRGYWLYSGEVKELTEKLRQNGGDMRIGDWVYALRPGEKTTFVHRYPVPGILQANLERRAMRTEGGTR